MSIEVFLLVNLLADLALLCTAARCAGCFSWRRTLTAALIAVGYAFAWALWPLPLAAVPSQLGLWALLSMVLAGRRDFRAWSRPALLLGEGALLSGGAAALCLGGVRTRVGGVLCALCGALLAALTCAGRLPASWQVRILLRSEAGAARFTALVDTGNRLREPVSGLPVLIAEARLLRGVLPEGGYRVLRYGSVGGDGSMACFRPSGVWIERGRRRTRAPDVWVAVSPRPLPGGWRALAPCEFACYSK